jgi:hypothetical protein
MPGKPSIKMGSLSLGFSLISIEQTIVLLHPMFDWVLKEASDISMTDPLKVKIQ